MKVFVLEIIEEFDELTIYGEVVGVFSTQEGLDKAIKTLEENGVADYSYQEIEMDKLVSNISDEEVNEMLHDLVKQDHLDLLVGEDGEFYFRLTDKGKELFGEE